MKISPPLCYTVVLLCLHSMKVWTLLRGYSEIGGWRGVVWVPLGQTPALTLRRQEIYKPFVTSHTPRHANVTVTTLSTLIVSQDKLFCNHCQYHAQYLRKYLLTNFIFSYHTIIFLIANQYTIVLPQPSQYLFKTSAHLLVVFNKKINQLPPPAFM